MSEFIGPALPPSPGFQQQQESSHSSADVSDTKSLYGPSPPAHDSEENDVQTRLLETTTYGPCLPPELRTTHGIGLEAPPVLCGPVLPPELRGSKEDSGDVPGPLLSHVFEGKKSSEEDTDVIGPLPATSATEQTLKVHPLRFRQNLHIGRVHDQAEDNSRRVREQFESRSNAMKDQLTGKEKVDSKPQREDWMLTLPAEFKPSGIGARKFRTGVVDSGDRSVWTDTPIDRLRKAQEGHVENKNKGKEVQRSSRDKELENYVRNYNETKRPESLMSMHRKRRAEECDKGGVKERKPFNRETDLEIGPNLVTRAKRQALMKDSKYTLQTKFTHGSKSFL